MTARDRKRYHGERAKAGFSHADVKRWLKLRGWIAESTNELDTPAVNVLIQAMATGDLSNLPPCPDTEDARAVEHEKSVRSGETDPFEGNHGIIRYYQYCADKRGKAAPVTYGKDNRLIDMLRKAHPDKKIQQAMRRFWCLETIPGEGYKLQAWLEQQDVLRTIALFRAVFEGLMPELFPSRKGDDLQRVRATVKRRWGKMRRDVLRRTHRPSPAGDFRGPAAA